MPSSIVSKSKSSLLDTYWHYNSFGCWQVETRIMTNSPKATIATLEQNADELAAELKLLGLSIVASSTAIGVIPLIPPL
jgi:hypothetical protein